jgi:hypothetical protein
VHLIQGEKSLEEPSSILYPPAKVGHPSTTNRIAAKTVGGSAPRNKPAGESWGTSVIERLAKDLQNSFPGIKGFSRTNIFRMRVFYLAYAKVPQLVGQLIGLRCFKSHGAIMQLFLNG